MQIFFIDECLFGMPEGSQKRIELTKHPNFRKNMWSLECLQASSDSEAESEVL